ncbi:MAG: MucBP domain-containing protein, partial [Bombilactobacillus sp.]
PGEYSVNYSYTPKGYGNVDLKTVSTKATVRVINRKYVKLKYVDQSGNVIDTKYLAGVPEAMSSGQHSGAYGSQFTLNPSETLTLNNKSYYKFKEAKLGTSTIDLNTNKNLTFGDNDQEVTLVYEGAESASTDQNALTVHYYLKGTTQKLKDDRKVGGRIGQEITLGKDADDQKAPTGYTMDTEQTDQKYTFKPEDGGEVAFYYTADPQKNITVNFVNAKTNQTLEETYVPEGHHTGDDLDLSDPDRTDSQSELKNHLPKGYHYAKGDELNGNTQPGNVKYTSSAQTVTVYVAGNKVAANDTNALTVHYYLKGTTQKLKEDRKVGGQVGVETTIKKDADDQKAPAGYTMDAEQTDQKYTFKPEGPGEVAFYYTANTQSNITVKFVNAKNGNEVKSDNPEGKTDDELDLQANGKYIQGAMPEGYHYATSEELNGKTQPDNVKYTPTPQTVT